MKILLVNKFFYLKGGPECVFFDTAKLLKDKGHQVLFFSMQHSMNFPSEYSRYFVSNINYEKLGVLNKIDASFKLLYSFEAKSKIERLIRQEKPDIAHIHNIYHQISPSILHILKKFNIPIVATLHDYKIACPSYALKNNGSFCNICKNKRYYHCFLKNCVQNSRLKSLVNTIEMYLHHCILHIYDLVDIFIVPSEFLKRKLEEMGFRGKIVYLPNFVPLENYQPQTSQQENAIVYFGVLTERKGLFTLIEAVKGLDVTVKIIGDGSIKERLEAKVKSEKLNNVKLLGYKSGKDLIAEIGNSMLVVLPSEWYENNPRSIIEGFALGKPALGARIGGIPELIKDGQTGLTFASGNTADLRAKIKYLINEPEQIARMGRNARQFVGQKFTAQRHYENLIKIYNQLIGKR